MAPSPARQDLAERGNRHGDRGKGVDEFPEHDFLPCGPLGLLGFGRPAGGKGSRRSGWEVPGTTRNGSGMGPIAGSLPRPPAATIGVNNQTLGPERYTGS